MARPPTKSFGKRRPGVTATAPPVKRSRHVALLLMGTVAVGGSAYALTGGQKCEPKPPGMAAPSTPQTGTECASRGSSSGGGHGGSWSRSSYFGGNYGSSSSSSSTASGPSADNVTRGGFGSFARSFATHFSGGG